MRNVGFYSKIVDVKLEIMFKKRKILVIVNKKAGEKIKIKAVNISNMAKMKLFCVFGKYC